MAKPTQADLEKALRDAGAAHHDYEQVILGGAYDEQWPGFYAAFVLGRLGDFTSASTLSQWLDDAPRGDAWATTAAQHVLTRLADLQREPSP